MNKRQILSKQLNAVEKQEKKFLEQKENTFIKMNIKPVINILHDKIPDKFKATLDMTFYKGFQFVFQKGTIYIERTYNKEKIQLEHDLNNYAIDKYSSKKHLKNIDKQSNQSNTLNQSIALLEGSVFGLLGIGLPDIPLFLAVIIKTIQEVALSYGYSYDTNAEKIYMLYIICGAMTNGEAQKNYNEQLDLLCRNIELTKDTEINPEDIMKETSSILSNTLLTSKLIQGLPVVGIIGGIINPALINKIGKYAKIKYKKRYLLQKLET